MEIPFELVCLDGADFDGPVNYSGRWLSILLRFSILAPGNARHLPDGIAEQNTFNDNAFQLLSQETEFRAMFAPISSGEEALSYALAATDLRPNFEDFDPMFKLLMEEYKITRVRKTAGGYAVNLFTETSPGCGCGLHTTDLVNPLITKDGEIRRLDSTSTYQFEACLD